MQRTYIKSLDGIRAIAILLVMAFHFDIIRFGWIGVQLFFVLSGYLISSILLKEKDKPESLGARLKKFWIRRSLRIFPIYYIYLVLFLAVYLFTAFPMHYLHDLPYLFSYTFNLTRISSSWHESPVYTHFWSLCVEEQFYLFFPFIIFLLSRSSLRVLTVIVLFATPIFRWLFSTYLLQSGKSSFEIFDIIYWFPLSHLDAFFAGTAINLFQLANRIKRPQLAFTGILIVMLCAGIVTYILDHHGHSFAISFGYNFGDTEQYQQVWYYTMLNIFFAALLLLLVTVHKNRLATWLQVVMENNQLVAIGKVSYGMYIFHWIIQTQLIERWIPVNDTNKYWIFIVDIPLVYLCAWLSFHFIEQRFTRLKDKLTGTKPPVKIIY
ncbi:peptidoglycan/LPS O-acetylase OafA/YrhL [Chitinophaga niastensis]|uniref:Peptidoglycan/LPS O-acetylase OafA/YrhL n=1 Tax=Chitinophaga niastensis TaxID=536980 RepID=A0A2P8HC19_CHINA|nr:acyltransferase [Chitinophaga niastensis]PSL43754.1 peptidoglycan/LPS O-acetylase OafA/YrhL [Chitinophaga niastensis]